MFAHPCLSILFSAHISTHLLICLSLYPLASYSLFVISSSHHLSLSPPAYPSLCCLSILLPICLSPTLSSVYPCVHPSSIYLVVAACQPPTQGWRSTSKPDRALAMRELKCSPNLRLSFHISPYLGSEVIQRCPDTLPGNF